MKTREKMNKCRCTAEEPVKENLVVPSDEADKDWQKEEPPYYHRDIF